MGEISIGKDFEVLSNNMDDDFDVKQMLEFIDGVSERVPQMINRVVDSLYNEQIGKKLGKTMGACYKELVESGLSEDKAMQIIEQYMKNLMQIGNK